MFLFPAGIGAIIFDGSHRGLFLTSILIE